ncbi:hypothetical protein [Methylovulum psychrotolerans]|uniref:Catalase n=1 Tax=Methylovulum psychrotolerans TaxID=1704499 RepID=A0A2S5CTC0_9GAMM|nr:hypothetical protein [Methylovulum psychrotolerans]POZ54026.1 hypothetical protein AADEFJLK_01069 [Methylovulum psychrotolerans]
MKTTCPFAAMADEINSICAKTFQKIQPDGSYRRTFHAPLIANLEGELEIFSAVPTPYRLGLFLEPKTYKVTARFSSSLFANENYPDARGMALTIHAVSGPVCEEAPEGEHTIVTINQPTFIARDAEDMLAFMRKMDGVKELTPFNVAPPTYTFPSLNPLKARWGFVQAMLCTLGQAFRRRDITQYQYNSLSPYRLGTSAMKYQFRPASTPMGKGRTLRERLHSHLLQTDLVFDFFIQPKTLATDLVDDLFQVWQSPTHLVGRLTFPVQDILATALFTEGERLSYNPWHCLQAHEPLGSINALRRVVYKNSALRRLT